ncbi:MAG: response regulator [Candidatus Eisenbacteria bacterium]
MARVLVVEDDPQVRMMLRMTLERAGCVVDEAEDGRVALRKHRQDPADLVITDIVMPEVEGIETIMELRRSSPALPIIAISGGGHESPESYLTIAEKLGANRTFAKPVDREEMLEAVNDLLAGAVK